MVAGTALLRVDLSDNPMTGAAAPALAAMLRRHPGLLAVNLGDTSLGDDGVSMVLDALGGAAASLQVPPSLPPPAPPPAPDTTVGPVPCCAILLVIAQPQVKLRSKFLGPIPEWRCGLAFSAGCCCCCSRPCQPSSL